MSVASPIALAAWPTLAQWELSSLMPLLRALLPLALWFGAPLLVGLSLAWALLGRRRWTRARCGACGAGLSRRDISEHGGCARCGRSLDQAGVPRAERRLALLPIAIVAAGVVAFASIAHDRWRTFRDGPLADRPAGALDDDALLDRVRRADAVARAELDRRLVGGRIDASWLLERIAAEGAQDPTLRALGAELLAGSPIAGSPIAGAPAPSSPLRDAIAAQLLNPASVRATEQTPQGLRVVVATSLSTAAASLRVTVAVIGATFEGQPIPVQLQGEDEARAITEPRVARWIPELRCPTLLGVHGTLELDVELWLDRAVTVERRHGALGAFLPRPWWPEPLYRRRERLRIAVGDSAVPNATRPIPNEGP